MPVTESVKAVPSDSVKVCCASVYTGTVSTVALNSSVRSPSFASSWLSVKDVLPSLTNTLTFCTGLAAVFPVAPRIDIGLVASLEPVGRVAPVAAMVNSPLPSDFIVAPPRSIVSAAKYAVCHLRDALPSWNTPSWLGIRLPAISIPGLESSVDIVVPATRIPSITTFPLLEISVRSALLGADIVEPIAVKSPKLLLPPPPPLIVIVLVAPVPLAVTPSPTKLIVVAAVVRLLPSS